MVRNPFNIFADKKNCCGCEACASVCDKGAITMEADEEGFWYPSVDESLCVGCRLCLSVCPTRCQKD